MRLQLAFSSHHTQQDGNTGLVNLTGFLRTVVVRGSVLLLVLLLLPHQGTDACFCRPAGMPVFMTRSWG